MKLSPALSAFLQDTRARLAPFLQDLPRHLHFLWRYLRLWIRRDSITKACCLGAAILLFYFIKFDGLASRDYIVSIDPLTDRSDLSIANINPNPVIVSLRGPKEAIRSFDGEGLGIRIHPKPPKKGDVRSVSLRRRSVTGIQDSALRVVAFKPSSVEVTFDSDVSMDFDLRPPAYKAPTQLKDYDVSFAYTNVVSIRGAKSILAQLRQLEQSAPAFSMETIDLSSRNQDFDTVVRIVPPKGFENLIVFNPEYGISQEGLLPVHVILKDTSVTREFKDIPLLLAERSGDSARYVSKPETVTVTINAKKSIADGVSVSNFVAIVNCTDLSGHDLPPDGIKRPVLANLRTPMKGVDILKVEPKEISVFTMPDPMPPSPPPPTAVEPQAGEETPSAAESAPAAPEPPATPEAAAEPQKETDHGQEG